MTFDEAIKKADKVKMPEEETPEWRRRAEELQKVFKEEKPPETTETTDQGQRQFGRRAMDTKPPLITVFIPVPNRPGEFTSLCTRRRFGVDGRLGATEEV